MTRISWGDISNRFYKAGVEKGVLYAPGLPGVPWNGLVSVTEDDDAPEDTYIFLDGLKIHTMAMEGLFRGSLQAFTYPEELETYIDVSLLASQARKTFGMSYRTGGTSPQIHILYNVLLSNGAMDRRTIGGAVDVPIFAWNLTTKSEAAAEGLYFSHLTVDVNKTSPETLADLEDILYGSSDADAGLPSPDELVSIFESNATLKVTHLGKGLYSIEGPTGVVDDNGDGTFSIDWPSVVQIDTDLYNISSL